jgi:hypothetical protein
MFKIFYFLNKLLLKIKNFSKVIDININNVLPSDLKIGAFLSIISGYLLSMLPENVYTYLKNHYWPEHHEHQETNSLTRRYKSSPSPVLHP